MHSDEDLGLLLSYQSAGDGSGFMQAAVRFGGFAGESATTVAEDDVLAFAESLVRFPFDVAALPVEVRWGLFPEAAEIALVVRPVGGRGQLACQVRLLQDSAYPQLGPDSVTVEVLTTYERLAAFGRALLDRSTPERQAHLTPEVFM